MMTASFSAFTASGANGRDKENPSRRNYESDRRFHRYYGTTNVA
jgi:hypothetical protein